MKIILECDNNEAFIKMTKFDIGVERVYSESGNGVYTVITLNTTQDLVLFQSMFDCKIVFAKDNFRVLNTGEPISYVCTVN